MTHLQIAAVALVVAGGLWWHGYRTGHGAAEATMRAAEITALQISAQAVREQRARADALDVANQTLQGIADELLAQDRGSCPLDDDTRRGILRIRP